jgi:hypothetical protein
MGSSKELPKYIKSHQNQEGYTRKQIFFSPLVTVKRNYSAAIGDGRRPTSTLLPGAGWIGISQAIT